MTQHIDVAIAGGGPVGLVAAGLLARAGVEVRIFEREPNQVRTEWRGSTLHPPTLAILDQLGMASEAVAGGVRVNRIQYRDLDDGDEGVAEYRYDSLVGRCEFPFRIQYEQYKMLTALRADAADRGLIDFSASVDDVRALSTGGVAFRVNSDEYGVRDYEASWLVGADGAHSVVRKAMGVAFPGMTYPTLSLVVAADVPLRRAIPDLADVSYCWSSEGRISLIHTPDVWRIALGTREPVSRSDLVDVSPIPDPSAAHASYLHAMRLIFDDAGDWMGVPLRQHQFYRSHQRVAERFAAGNMLIIGDAAHLNATQGGMGLNSGIHDAWEVASCLVDVLRGPQTADRYVAELSLIHI